MDHRETTRKYWYKQKSGKPGKQLPPKYKHMFSNKQIICIKYMEITEDDEREIFRVRGVISPLRFSIAQFCFKIASTTRYGPQLRREDESGSADPTTNAHPRSRPRVFHASSYPRNQRPSPAFRWIARSLQTILDPRPIIKRTTATTAQQITWLKDTVPLDPAWKKRVQHSYKLLVDTLSSYPECLKVSRGPATIAPIDLVMMVLLVFEFHEKLPASQLADALRALRMAARKETKDLMWKAEAEHMGYYLVFLDRLVWFGEAALNPGSGKDTPVAMDVDPPPKRQRTGGT